MPTPFQGSGPGTQEAPSGPTGLDGHSAAELSGRLLGDSAGRRRQAADRRREETIAMLGERGSMSPSELATHFGVSVMTVHRDLNELQRRGMILKSHGGVSAQPAGVFEGTLAYRETHMVDAKRAIAAAATAFLTTGATVALDDSTTASHLVPLLTRHTPLTVATNFLRNLRPLADTDGVQLLGLGGDYDARSDAFGGLVCLRDIGVLHVDVAFLSAAAVGGGAAHHPSTAAVEIKQALLAAADRRYLLVDHTKLGRHALHEIAPVTEFDAVVVDAGGPAAALDELRESGATVVVAD